MHLLAYHPKLIMVKRNFCNVSAQKRGSNIKYFLSVRVVLTLRLQHIFSVHQCSANVGLQKFFIARKQSDSIGYFQFVSLALTSQLTRVSRVESALTLHLQQRFSVRKRSANVASTTTVFYT